MLDHWQSKWTSWSADKNAVEHLEFSFMCFTMASLQERIPYSSAYLPGFQNTLVDKLQTVVRVRDKRLKLLKQGLICMLFWRSISVTAALNCEFPFIPIVLFGLEQQSAFS